MITLFIVEASTLPILFLMLHVFSSVVATDSKGAQFMLSIHCIRSKLEDICLGSIYDDEHILS